MFLIRFFSTITTLLLSTILLFGQGVPINWSNLSNCDANAGTLTRTVSSNDPGGGTSADTLLAGQDGWAEMTVSENVSSRAFGMTASFIGNFDYKSYDYCIFIKKKGKVSVIEAGSKTKAATIASTGDKLAIRRVGTTIYYMQNGAVFWTSVVPSNTQLIAQSTIYKIAGGQLFGAQQCFDCVDLPSGGDNLGNHNATQTVVLNGQYISDDGDSEGILIDAAGTVEVTGLKMTAGASNGYVMVSGGAGDASWADPNSINADADADSTNELDAIFQINSNITSNAKGDYANDDFVFGSSSLNDDANVDHHARMLFDKSKHAFRAGFDNSKSWDEDSLGVNSFASGINSKAAGLSSSAMGAGTEASGDYATAMGNATVASGSNSTASGNATVASGSSSTALGNATVASGSNSTASGNATVASGSSSTALGNATVASGSNSTSLGDSTTASGDHSAAMGVKTEAPSFAETTIGSYNTSYVPNCTNSVDTNDRVFTIGNGTSDLDRSDAFVVLKRAFVGIGLSNPTYALHVIGDAGKTVGGNQWDNLSDARLKDVQDNIPNSLDLIEKLNPVRYTWNDKRTKEFGQDRPGSKYGFLAQEVKDVIPEFIRQDKNGFYW